MGKSPIEVAIAKGFFGQLCVQRESYGSPVCFISILCCPIALNNSLLHQGLECSSIHILKASLSEVLGLVTVVKEGLEQESRKSAVL
jgi:hypothetical protein